MTSVAEEVLHSPEHMALNGSTEEQYEEDDHGEWPSVMDDYQGFAPNLRPSNAHGGRHNVPNSSTFQCRANYHQKFYYRIYVSPIEESKGRFNFSSSALTEIRSANRIVEIGRTMRKDRADRATIEKVMDRRTLMIIIKMMNDNVFHWINGCIATGKEANVYHATTTDGQELAVKVFKTSVLSFKDRDRYVRGDFRFRRGLCKHNNREMVKVWAEKEYRNLCRLKEAGIRCPSPVLLNENVLVMEFIGKSGWAAPRLKDADLSLDQFCQGYMEMTIAMRKMHRKCKLVHADLSEYNILCYKGHFHIIDVSQSVDMDHPNNLEFLREDCVHVSDFFKKHGVAVMTYRELFDFIVDPHIADKDVDSCLEKMQEKTMARDLSAEDAIADQVFVQSYIPTTLYNVRDAEADVMRITSGQDTGDMYYTTITGLNHILSQVQPEKEQESEASDTESSNDSDTESECSENENENESDSEGNTLFETEAKAHFDKKAARKENKRKVKEEKREARKTKVPKAVKKRKKKLSKSHKTW